MIESADDRLVFFDDFSVIATHSSGTIPVFFDRVYDSLSGGIGANQITATALTELLGAVSVGDSLTIEGEGTFTVEQVEPRGDGKITRLLLEETLT